MKDIKKTEPVLLEGYGIHVNPYLTYAQIQQIVNAVVGFDSWAERQQNIDMLILYHATDIGTEKLEEIGHDTLLSSGLIGAVKNEIENIYSIHSALEYTESPRRLITRLSHELPKYMEQVEEVVKSGGKSKK